MNAYGWQCHICGGYNSHEAIHREQLEGAVIAAQARMRKEGLEVWSREKLLDYWASMDTSPVGAPLIF